MGSHVARAVASRLGYGLGYLVRVAIATTGVTTRIARSAGPALAFSPRVRRAAHAGLSHTTAVPDREPEVASEDQRDHYCSGKRHQPAGVHDPGEVVGDKPAGISRLPGQVTQVLRSARPVRRHLTNSRRRPPRPCT